MRVAHALELALLQDAEQLRLQLQRRFADLVQKDGAVVGELEAADPLGDRTGERPLLVPEQLALEQACRHRGAVALDERVRASGTQMVHRARNELFARARLAADQHGRLGRRDQLDLIDEVAQRAAAADDALVGHVCRAHIGERQCGDLGARARGRHERDNE